MFLVSRNTIAALCQSDGIIGFIFKCQIQWILIIRCWNAYIPFLYCLDGIAI